MDHYYFHTASQWEVPENFQSPQQPSPSSPVLTTVTSADPSVTDTSEMTQPTNQESLKRPAEQAGVDDALIHQHPKRRAPYGGAWTTVAVIEREEDQEDQEEDKEEEESKQDGADKMRFEEKKLPGGLVQEESEYSFKRFSFKKRTNKERPKIRERTSDIY